MLPAHSSGANLQPARSAHSAASSLSNTPRNNNAARPGTMGSLLEVGGPFGQPGQLPGSYASQGSLDGELPSHMRAAPGAQAPIGPQRRSSGQGEVPPALRAFWEAGGGGMPAQPPAPGSALNKSISLDSGRQALSQQQQALHLSGAGGGGGAIPASLDLEALDAALEAAANAAEHGGAPGAADALPDHGFAGAQPRLPPCPSTLTFTALMPCCAQTDNPSAAMSCTESCMPPGGLARLVSPTCPACCTGRA
jgi:hypothetical protein